MSTDKLLTVKDAAKLLQVHPMTVYGWVRGGRLPCLRAGGRIRFRRESLFRWLGEVERRQNA